MPWLFIIVIKLGPKRFTAFVPGAGHQVHAVNCKYNDDFRRAVVLDDDGVDFLFKREAPTLECLVSREVASPL